MLWVNLLACLASLALALAFLLAGARGRLATRVGLLLVTLFAWNFSSLAHDLSHQRTWVVLDLAASPFTVALVLDVALTFAGRAREARRGLWLSYAWFSSISLSSVLGITVPALERWPNSVGMNALFLGGLVVAFGAALAVLVGHYRRHGGRERQRTAVLLGGLVLGGVTGAAVLANSFGYYFPASAAPGALVGAGALGLALAHEDLVGVRIGPTTWVLAVVLAVGSCGALLAVFQANDPGSTAGVFGASTVMLVVVVLAREVASQRIGRRKHEADVIARGRLSDQLVHDLRNPLAAMKGAAQYLEAERATLGAAQVGMVELLVAELDRIERLVDEHHRMARADPHRAPANLRGMLERLQASASAVAPAHPLVVSVEPAAERGELDADLVLLALDNLVRNAREALPEGGAIEVGARRDGRYIVLTVRDHGRGLDPRAGERAFDELFTTKPGGRGLGLAFVRRVARAHGGEATILSAAGGGTVVTMRLLVEPPG